MPVSNGYSKWIKKVEGKNTIPYVFPQYVSGPTGYTIYPTYFSTTISTTTGPTIFDSNYDALFR